MSFFLEVLRVEDCDSLFQVEDLPRTRVSARDGERRKAESGTQKKTEQREVAEGHVRHTRQRKSRLHLDAQGAQKSDNPYNTAPGRTCGRQVGNMVNIPLKAAPVGLSD